MANSSLNGQFSFTFHNDFKVRMFQSFFSSYRVYPFRLTWTETNDFSSMGLRLMDPTTSILDILIPLVDCSNMASFQYNSNCCWVHKGWLGQDIPPEGGSPEWKQNSTSHAILTHGGFLKRRHLQIIQKIDHFSIDTIGFGSPPWVKWAKNRPSVGEPPRCNSGPADEEIEGRHREPRAEGGDTQCWAIALFELKMMGALW